VIKSIMERYTAIYARVSTEDQRSDSQECELAAYCSSRHWGSTQLFRDCISGMKNTRPELGRLMQEIRAGRVERVVCFKLDRLGRSLTHLALILDELGRLGVPLICTSQGIDTSTDNPVGRLQLGVLMAVAEFERGLIRERTKAGLAAARARGTRLGRPPVPAGLLTRIAELREGGLGIRAIARAVKLPPSTVSAALAKAP
jgi:DNA invertase Pin-like site-specific DNA recombinase